MVTIPYPNILLDALSSGIMIVDDAFNVRYWNKWLEINTTIPAKEIIGKNLQHYYPQIDYKVLSRKIRTTIRLHSPTFYDASVTNRFIEIPRTKITTSLLANMQLQVTISPYIPEEGLVMVSIYDISDLHELKLTLQHQMQKIAELNEELSRDKAIIDSNLMIAKVDGECFIEEVTETFLNFFGYCEENVIGRPLGFVFGDGVLDFEADHIRKAVTEQKRWAGELKAQRGNGEGVWLDAVVTQVNDDYHAQEISYTVIFHDISDKKRIELLSITDPLTKLFNRYKFNEVFEKMVMRRHWSEKHSFALVICDIDYFKKINDTFGHVAGDKVLVETAHALSRTIRTGDILARWGGEEFVCLIPDVDLQKVLYVAEKLRKCVEEVELEGIPPISASFGVSLFSAGDTQEMMLQRADNALYRAKQKGRNRVEYADRQSI